MRFARLGEAGQEQAVLQHDGLSYQLADVLPGPSADIDARFFEGGGIERTRAALKSGQLQPLENAQTLRVGAPLATPGKVVCIGLNYRDHADETGAAYPAEPVVFMKDPSTIGGPFDDVLIPRGSTKTDWEVELGVVIGAEARYLASPDDAVDVIAGYVLSHDVSERAFQLERGGQWDKGKSCETFNPLGPQLVTADEVPDPQCLGLRLWVNGVARQHGSTSNMIFSIRYVVWYLSQFMVLRPGDLINTGTPAGVALGMNDHAYLRAGDVVELEIDGLGRARQTLVQA